MTTGCRYSHAGALLSLSIAFVFAALLIAGCGSSDQPSNRPGKLDVHSQLDGRVPGNGTLTLGATNTDGRTVASTTIRVRALTRATLTVPPGSYRVAVWLPHTRLTRALALCSVPAEAKAGTTVTITLFRLWH
jgi:hypothetical protein